MTRFNHRHENHFSDWLTPQEAMDYLGLKKTAFGDRVRRGIIKAYRPGGHGDPRYKRSQIDRIMQLDRNRLNRSDVKEPHNQDRDRANNDQ